jgi:hypothetical protein
MVQSKRCFAHSIVCSCPRVNTIHKEHFVRGPPAFAGLEDRFAQGALTSFA